MPSRRGVCLESDDPSSCRFVQVKYQGVPTADVDLNRLGRAL